MWRLIFYYFKRTINHVDWNSRVFTLRGYPSHRILQTRRPDLCVEVSVIFYRFIIAFCIIIRLSFIFLYKKFNRCKYLVGRFRSSTVQCFNLLRPSDAIWRQGSRSTLVQVMVCCLTALSHYLNQCWLITSEVQRHFHMEEISREMSRPSIAKMNLKTT